MQNYDTVNQIMSTQYFIFVMLFQLQLFDKFLFQVSKIMLAIFAQALYFLLYKACQARARQDMGKPWDKTGQVGPRVL